MGEAAVAQSPLKANLLNRPLTGEAPELDSADDRLDKVTKAGG